LIDRFNALPAGEAERMLYTCFASTPWVRRVSAGRPYADFAALLAACDSAWAELSPADWLSAFAAHPRIGEGGGHTPESSEREQIGVRSAAGRTLAELKDENRRYEARFGHVFLISASGRSADEILAALRLRMNNDPATEVAVAAEELRKITRLRLERMLNE
jgi:OHCU decarboxylase